MFLKRSAADELENIGSDRDRRRIADRIRGLADDPRPVGCARLAGRKDRLRLRQGDYRILYSIDEEKRVVTVVRIAHRRDVYRPDR